MEKIKCKACKKPIVGVVKIDTRRKKVGNKIENIVDYYDEECFILLNKERSNGRRNKKGTN